jgi:hypothetical protein
VGAVRQVTVSSAGFVLFCFFLLWLQVSCFTLRDSASGFELARQKNQVLWLIPLFMFLTLLTGLVRMIWEQRTAIFALISIVGGGLSAYLMYSEQIGNGQLTGVAAVQMTLWFWLGLLAGLLVVATALLFYATQGKPP